MTHRYGCVIFLFRTETGQVTELCALDAFGGAISLFGPEIVGLRLVEQRMRARDQVGRFVSGAADEGFRHTAGRGAQQQGNGDAGFRHDQPPIASPRPT